MNPLAFDEETLMAFADGQLDVRTAAAVAAAEQTIPAVAERIELFRRTAQLARTAHAASMPEVPDKLMAGVLAAIAKSNMPTAQATKEAGDQPEPSSNADGQRPAHKLQPEGGLTQVATDKAPAANQSYWSLVASVGAVAVGVLAFVAGRQTAPDPQMSQAVPAGIVLTTDAAQLRHWTNTLAQVPSGQTRELASAQGQGARMGMLASFRDSSGALCREFSWTVQQQPTVAGVACQDNSTVTADNTKGWRLAYAAAALHVDSGYAPASASSALDAYVASIGGGPVLTQAQEREALKTMVAP